MTDFRPLTQSELEALPVERQIAYHHEARRLERHEDARIALGVLVWGHEDRVRFWVSQKVPGEHVEDVCQEVLASALVSTFEGTEVGQFRAWLRSIARRRAADFHAARERRPEQEPLPEEHEGAEGIWGVSGQVPDPTAEVVERSVVEQALGELSEVHRRVVELGGRQDLGFEQRPAREVADLVNDQFSESGADPMTETNVHQILSRFHRRARKLAGLDPEDAAGG